MNYVESHYSVLYFGIFVNSKLENTVEFKVNSIWQNIIDPIVIHISTEHEAVAKCCSGHARLCSAGLQTLEMKRRV